MGVRTSKDSTPLEMQSLTKPDESSSKHQKAENIQLGSRFYIQEILHNLFFKKIKDLLRNNCLVPEDKARILSYSLLDRGDVFYRNGGVLFNGPIPENSEWGALKDIQDLVTRYRNLRENRRVFHLLLHSPEEHGKRIQQFVSYATVNPQINTPDFGAPDSNAVIAEVRNVQQLLTVLENFLHLSVTLEGKLEALYIVFNFHGKSDGTIRLSEEDDVKVDDIIEFLQHCRAKRLDVSQTTDLYLIFAQCHGHSFNQDKAKRCDQISDIWWFTSDQFPATINFMSPKRRLEHLELMRYARSPLKQRSLRMVEKDEELERLRMENEQLKLQVAAMESKNKHDKPLSGQPSGNTVHQETVIDTTFVRSAPQLTALLSDEVPLDSYRETTKKHHISGSTTVKRTPTFKHCLFKKYPKFSASR